MMYFWMVVLALRNPKGALNSVNFAVTLVTTLVQLITNIFNFRRKAWLATTTARFETNST